MLGGLSSCLTAPGNLTGRRSILCSTRWFPLRRHSNSSDRCCVYLRPFPTVTTERAQAGVATSHTDSRPARLVTLAEHCGIPADEKVADEDWLKLASSQGWDV